MNIIKVKRLNKDAVLPTRTHEHDAGLDLYALEDVAYKPGDTIYVHTGVAADIPNGYVGLVRDRSSVSKRRIKVSAGVVDAGYRGSIDVLLLNLSGEHGCIKKGEKIAQLLIIPVATPSVVEVSELTETVRSEKGWGSSGT